MVWEDGGRGRGVGRRKRERMGREWGEGGKRERKREREGSRNRLATGSKQGHVNYKGKRACYSVNSKILL